MMLKQTMFLMILLLATFTGSNCTMAFQSETAKEQQPTIQQPTIQLWPNGLPADAKPVPESKIERLKQREVLKPEHLAYVAEPSLTVFHPEAKKANGCAMIICPGGGYNILAWRKEGIELAEYLNRFGVTAFVLKYRVPRRDPNRIYWEPLQDVQRAIRLVRSNAAKFKIAPNRIGVMGFSAGGHLTVMAGTKYQTKTYGRVDKADDTNCRPDFICPIYAAYLGKDFNDNLSELDPNLELDSNTPPTFLAVTGDDKMRGALSALLYARLRQLDVPAELHVYTRGGHGYGIRPNENPVGTWHHRMTDWMRSQGYLKPPKTGAGGAINKNRLGESRRLGL